ncbi:MAG TPA: pyridoxine 5'-phosphate synthase, partial [Paludibacteraceae bacterium]|nr:pyridoxine 5'-phosphate synthase [Paludibacteraceae bacterium]
TEFNIEGYPSPNFMKLVTMVKPTQVTLVPDPPEAITSNAGWDTEKHLDFLKDITAELQDAGIRVSIFVDANIKSVEYAALAGADRVELYTEPYAREYAENREKAVAPFIEAAKAAKKLGLGLNAGHDLNLQNLHYLHACIPWLDEVSIGHALICDALYLGLQETIKQYKNQLK